MSNEKPDKLPRNLHFVGVGGIGMSALAQMGAALGLTVTGSDRAAASPENARIFDALRAQGIRIFPQDGSVYDTCRPGALVYSTAIENDNPDFAKAPAGITHIHRSAALEYMIEECHTENMIAVAGTCGKTSVSAWLSEALYHIGADPGVLCGGLVNAFADQKLAGNYRAGGGKVFVVEADESDKSLLNYTADTAIVLNIGTDHYSKEELAEVFRQFIRNTRKNVIVSDEVLRAVGTDVCREKNTIVFSAEPGAPEIDGFPVVRLDSYRAGCGSAFCAFDGMPEIPMRAPGHYNALNALAVYAVLVLLGYKKEDACRAVGSFSGVWRRFDLAGRTENGAIVYDDYAHNPEKILSCLDAAHGISCGRVILLFQPHGFKPFGSMKDVLFSDLESALHENDVFGLMPVYYAGGTSSFKPSSPEVAADFRTRSGRPERYPDFADRASAEAYLMDHAKAGDVIVIAGARDNSLSLWAKKIAKKT